MFSLRFPIKGILENGYWFRATLGLDIGSLDPGCGSLDP